MFDEDDSADFLKFKGCIVNTKLNLEAKMKHTNKWDNLVKLKC